MNNAKYIINGVTWTVVYNIISILYGLVSVPFLINHFGKEEYGLIGLAMSINVYIQLMDMGMTNSNVRFFSEYIAKKDIDKTQRLFRTTNLLYLVIGLINTFILFGLSFFVGDIFKVTVQQAITLRNLLWVLGLNATFSWISSCYDQFLRANDLISWIKKRSSFLKCAQFLILVATISLHLSIEAYFFGYVFVLTIILPLTMNKARKIMPEVRYGIGFDKGVFKEVMPYALTLFSFGIFQFCAFNFRPLFLGNLSGPGAVAEYNVMSTVAAVVSVLSTTFLHVLLPLVTKMSVNAQEEQIHTLMETGTKFVNILISFIVFSLVLVSYELLYLYVGAEFTNLRYWLCLWLLTLLSSHRNVMTSLVFTQTKLKSVAYMSAIAMLIAIISYCIFIPLCGVGGVVIGFLLHEFIHTVFYYVYFLPKRCKVNTSRIFIKSVLPIWLFYGLVCLILVFAFEHSGMNQILSAITKELIFAIAILVYTIVFALGKNDKQLILNTIKR